MMDSVFLLTSLKYSLRTLSVADNPRITEDAVPALILLSKLNFLSILDTSIGMSGLRRIAGVIEKEQRIMDVEIPEICEIYLLGRHSSHRTGLSSAHCFLRKDIHKKYLLDIKPPLVSASSLCGELSAAALKRNLAAHAECNKDIVAAGTKVEMKERLEGILTVREMDLVVRGMIWDQAEEQVGQVVMDDVEINASGMGGDPEKLS
jgi:hypothetical protein